MARTLEYSILGFDHKEMFLLRFLVFPVAVARQDIAELHNFPTVRDIHALYKILL